MLTEVSICLLLLRISPNKRIIRPIQSLVFFLVVSNIVLSLLWILQCIPVDGAWDTNKQKRIIISQAIRPGLLCCTKPYGVISIISDFILAALPSHHITQRSENPSMRPHGSWNVLRSPDFVHLAFFRRLVLNRYAGPRHVVLSEQ